MSAQNPTAAPNLQGFGLTPISFSPTSLSDEASSGLRPRSSRRGALRALLLLGPLVRLAPREAPGAAAADLDPDPDPDEVKQPEPVVAVGDGACWDCTLASPAPLLDLQIL
jgi:hypothetical protein